MDKLDPSHEIDEPQGLKPENELPQPEGLDPEHELPSGSENQRIGESESSENSEKLEKSETHSLAQTRAAREEKESSSQGPHPEGEGIKDSGRGSEERMEKIEEDYKKNAEPSGSGSSKVKLILALVFAIFATLAVLFYFFSDQIFRQEEIVPPAIPTPIPTVTMVPVENLDTQITYTIPVGWTKEPQTDQFDSASIRISSPDYQPSVGIGLDSGAQISIIKMPNSENKTLDQLILDYQNTAGQSNFVKVQVGGLPAYKWVNTYEGISDIYLTIQGNSIWLISVMYPWEQQLAATTKVKYQSVVNSFIQSIQFTNDTQIACTMDAKLCPDGSSVGRVAPNCEFAPCPGN